MIWGVPNSLCQTLIPFTVTIPSGIVCWPKVGLSSLLVSRRLSNQPPFHSALILAAPEFLRLYLVDVAVICHSVLGPTWLLSLDGV